MAEEEDGRPAPQALEGEKRRSAAASPTPRLATTSPPTPTPCTFRTTPRQGVPPEQEGAPAAA